MNAMNRETMARKLATMLQSGVDLDTLVQVTLDDVAVTEIPLGEAVTRVLRAAPYDPLTDVRDDLRYDGQDARA